MAWSSLHKTSLNTNDSRVEHWTVESKFWEQPTHLYLSSYSFRRASLQYEGHMDHITRRQNNSPSWAAGHQRKRTKYDLLANGTQKTHFFFLKLCCGPLLVGPSATFQSQSLDHSRSIILTYKNGKRCRLSALISEKCWRSSFSALAQSLQGHLITHVTGSC